jgi:hypothetical protein
MNYEIFISYTNQEPDKTIAQKLFKAFNSMYFPVFLDKERLEAGAPWNEQLEQTLKTSKHLLVIWSSKANNSQWVQKEIAKFTEDNKSGLVFFVCLDIDSKAYSELQSILEFKDGGIYPDKIDLLTQDLQDRVVNRIRKSIYKNSGSKPIRRAVFTMTIDKLMKANIRQVTKDEIKNNYGERYADWKPFGSAKDIVGILDELLYVDINQKTINEKNIVFHWEDIDWKEKTSKLWLPSRDQNNEFINENTTATANEISLLETGPCVLILDPYALNDVDVKVLFMRAYNKCIANKQALIMALNSYPLSSQLNYLRQQLQNDAESFYENYFEPKITMNNTLAECFANTIDDKEVKRNLRVTLRSIISESAGVKPDNPFTRGKF